jgi:hypothetical protein
VADRSERYESWFVAVARALFSTRLHLLRLTEVVRHGIKPNDEGVLLLPPELDEQMQQQAFDFVLAMYPPEMHVALHAAKRGWLQVQ